MSGDFAGFLIYAGVVFFLAIVALVLPHLLGPRRPTPAKLAPYESGKIPVGPARRRFRVHFYRYAALFLVLDAAAFFLFPWAVVFRRAELTLRALVAGTTFVILLIGGYIYAWHRGGFEWE